MIYEYKVIPLRVFEATKTEQEVEDELNGLGADNWELVGVNNYYAFLLNITSEEVRNLQLMFNRDIDG